MRKTLLQTMRLMCDLSVATLWLVVWLLRGNPFLAYARGRRPAGP